MEGGIGDTLLTPLGTLGTPDRPIFARPPEYWTPFARRADIPSMGGYGGCGV